MVDQLTSAEPYKEIASPQSTVQYRGPIVKDVILKDIQRRLAHCGYSEIRLLDCEYHEGMVILRGRLSSHYLKQLSQEALRKHPEVKMIMNMTEVITPSQVSTERSKN